VGVAAGAERRAGAIVEPDRALGAVYLNGLWEGVAKASTR